MYGKSSGVDPRICWPSNKVIEDTKEYETVAYPYTITQMMEENARKKNEFEEQRRKRQDEIVKKFSKLEQMKKDLKDKISKKEAEAIVIKVRNICQSNSFLQYIYREVLFLVK